MGSEYFSKRGFAPLGQFRYKGRGYDFATVRFHSLLDRQPGTQNQGGVDLLADGRYDFDSETRVVSDTEYLSSYAYRQAFEENYATAINSEVKSTVFLSHSHKGYFEGGRLQSLSELRKQPELDERRGRDSHPARSLRCNSRAGSVAGDHATHVGRDCYGSGLSRSEPGFETSRIVPRLDFYPHLSLPVHFDGWTLRPVVAVRDTFYGKSQNPGPMGQVPGERDATLEQEGF